MEGTGQQESVRLGVSERDDTVVDYAYPTYDLIVVGEVGLAVLAAIDLLGVEVDVVGEAHPGCRWALALPLRT